MNLKEYKVQPDEGLYEKIEKRLVRRRWMRIGGELVALCVVGVVVVMAVTGREPETAPQATVAKVAEAPAVQQVASRDSIQKKPDVEVVSFKEEVPDCSVRPVETPSVAAETKPAEESGMTTTAAAIVQPSVSPSAPAKTAAAEPQTLAVLDEEPAAAEEPVTEALAGENAGVAKGPVEHTDNLMWAPNVIVPNGEVDENRRFKLKFNSAVSDFHIYIYNRGGRQVFKSENPSFEWDGTSNGTAMPQGAYVWVAKYRDTDGRACQERGTVTIIR